MITVDELIRIHDQVIKDFGGTPGIIDRNLLESALKRPFTGLTNGSEYYKGDFPKAAVLLESLIQFHPFTDGNKRAGMIITQTFLSTKGYDLEFTTEQVEELVVDIANKELSLKQIERWLNRHAKKRDLRED
jgi:death-on-curing protein